MRNSSKDLSVFDFNSDVPNAGGEKLSKYKFLEAFASGSYPLKHPDLSDLPLIDLHEVGSPEQSTPDINLAAIEGKSELDDVKACSRSYHKHNEICNNDFRPESFVQDFVMETSTILAASAYDDEDSELLSSETPVNLMSDEDENCTSASEASTGDFPESDGLPECPAVELCHSACEKMDDDQNTVVVCPDYVNYRDTLFLESELTFCSDCVKIECSDASRTGEKLILECGIADVIWISCQWSRSVGALLFKLWIKTNAGHDVEKYVASIADVFWMDKEKKIKSLAERYKDIWNALPDNYALEDDMLKTHISFSKRYFSEVMEPFEDVIYPKGDPDAVSISKRDIELLEPDTFINDTIIDFYIKYLQNKVQPNEKRRFHFFNSFFFRKLADLDKDPGSISQGRAAFQRVRKWTRKLNIFEKDYIFIPVNFNLHWSLLVICHPGEISTFVDDDLKSSAKVPCILHMDSIKGSHNGLKDLIQSYLLEEWKERHPELPDDITRRFSNIRFVSLELPQQENSSDCGLFLLHYVELFLVEAPVSFNLTRITRLSNFLTADWFPPAEASFKRFHIRGLLYELLRDSSENPTLGCSNEDFPSSADDVDEAVEFLSAEESPTKIVNGSTSTPLLVTQDDNFEQTAALESLPTALLMEELEDAKANTTEHLAGDENQDSSDHPVSVIKDQDMCQSPVDSPTPQICLTSYIMSDPTSCESPSISEEAVVDTLSTALNPVSNEKTETPKLTSVVDDCTFVPDSPNTSDENPIEFANILQEMDDSKMEIVRQDDPSGICVAVDDHCDNDEKHLEFLVNDTKERLEDCEKTDTSETDNGKAGHSLENNQTAGVNRKVEEDSCNAESFDGGDKAMSPPEKGGEVSNLQESNDAKETSQRNADALKEEPLSHDLGMSEVIFVDDDAVQTKRNRISESVQQISKRRKIVRQDIRRRITRSCTKECAS